MTKNYLSEQDKLNGEQMDILKKIYNKCLNTNLNLSLIEGPPGECTFQNGGLKHEIKIVNFENLR